MHEIRCAFDVTGVVAAVVMHRETDAPSSCQYVQSAKCIMGRQHIALE
jgi:hypothetical protein